MLPQRDSSCRWEPGVTVSWFGGISGVCERRAAGVCPRPWHSPADPAPEPQTWKFQVKVRPGPAPPAAPLLGV